MADDSSVKPCSLVLQAVDIYRYGDLLFLLNSNGELDVTSACDDCADAGILESGRYYDASTNTEHHFVDVETDEEVMVVQVSVSKKHQKIVAVDRLV